jgi:hypothetical protein
MTPATKLLIEPVPKAWPFEEARKVAERLDAAERAEAIFETGYGPSGLPHIGTFGEVARTSWVRHAYQTLTGRPSRLIAFSDDMDGLRKVPDNVRNPELLRAHLGQPLSRIPDPFGTHESYSAHNNAMLRDFLDAFGFQYEFASASDYYRAGRFDAALLRVLERHEEIVAAILPTLGAERAASYSPILPIHPVTGVVMQVRIDRIDLADGAVEWTDPTDGSHFLTPVTGGACKLQWKADWAMRWHALGIDYEMSGKDLIDAARRLHVRVVPRRARPEDQQKQGQRPVGRRVVALRPAREPRAVHVQSATTSQAAVFRCDSACGGRVCGQRREGPGAAGAGHIRQPRLAHPCRACPGRCPHAGIVRDAA